MHGGARVSKIEDIGDVIETRGDPSESSIQGVSIVGVKDLVSFKTCKTKIIVVKYPDTIVTCNKCNTAQNGECVGLSHLSKKKWKRGLTSTLEMYLATVIAKLSKRGISKYL